MSVYIHSFVAALAQYLCVYDYLWSCIRCYLIFIAMWYLSICLLMDIWVVSILGYMKNAAQQIYTVY